MLNKKIIYFFISVEERCYRSNADNQNLDSIQTTFKDNSPLKCITFCGNNGYLYAGMKNG